MFCKATVCLPQPSPKPFTLAYTGNSVLSSQSTGWARCLSLLLVDLDSPSLGLGRTLSSFSEISTAVPTAGSTLRRGKLLVVVTVMPTPSHSPVGATSLDQEPVSCVAGWGTFLCCVIFLISDVFSDSQERIQSMDRHQTCETNQSQAPVQAPRR